MRKSFFEQLQDLPARWRLPVAIILGVVWWVGLSFGFLVAIYFTFVGGGFPPLDSPVVSIIVIVAGCGLGVLGARYWYKKGL